MPLTALIPKMTSATTPSGEVSASSTYGTYYPYLSASQEIGLWITADGTHPQWWQYQFPSAQTATHYELVTHTTLTWVATAWTLQGSNNGSTWTDLDTRTSQGTSLQAMYEIASPGSYSYYRLYITAGSATFDCFYMIQLYAVTGTAEQAATPTGFSLASGADGLTWTLAFTSTETDPVGYVFSGANIVAAGINGEKIRGLTNGASYTLKVLADGKTLSDASSSATAATLVANYSAGAANILTGQADRVDGTVTNGAFDEAARNVGVAADKILTGNSIKIANVTTAGTFDEAARNTDPGVANVIAPTAYKIQNVSLTGTNSGSATDPDYVIHSQGGNWIDEEVTAGNLIVGAEAGVGGAIVGTAVAADPNDIIASAGGNYQDSGLIPVNVRDTIAFGVAETGTLKPVTDGLDQISWTTDENGDYMPLIPPKAFNYSAQNVTLAGTVYGYDNQYLGSLDVAPQVTVPTVNAVDSRDGQHAVVTVTGADAGTTNIVAVGWWGQNGIQEWMTAGTLTGNGSVTIDKPQGLYACRVNSSLVGYGSVYGMGNLFYVSDATNLTRVRIRDNVSRATLRVAHRLGFEAVYESPDRLPFNIWVIPEESSESAGMLGGETGTVALTVHVPRQVDFPPEDGIVPGARVGINGVWFAFDIRWATETIDLAPVFTMNLRRLDISVEYDGADV
jgi:hypothetical protein